MVERTKENEQENLIIHVVCWAGSDRSAYVAEELNKRGYFATHGGVILGHNYTTSEDLVGVGTVIFTDDNVRDEFKKDKRLTKQLRANNATSLVLCITEEEKQIARQGGPEKMEELRQIISSKLDLFGFGYKKMKY